MPAKERLQIGLSALEQAAHLKGEHGRQYQENDDEHICQGRREVALELATENHQSLAQSCAPPAPAAEAALPRAGAIPERAAGRLRQGAEHLIQPPRFQMQLRHVPVVLDDDRAHGRQCVLPGRGTAVSRISRSSDSTSATSGEARDFAPRRGQLLGLFEAQADGMVVARAGLERARRLVRHDTAVGNDDGASAHLVNLFQDVGGDDDEFVLAELIDEPAHFVLLIGVQAIGRLVENQDLRVVDERLGQTDAAPESLGERFNHLLDDRGECEALDDDAASLAAPRARQAADIGDEIEKFADRHFTVARRTFGQITHAGLGGHRLCARCRDRTP